MIASVIVIKKLRTCLTGELVQLVIKPSLHVNNYVLMLLEVEADTDTHTHILDKSHLRKPGCAPTFDWRAPSQCTPGFRGWGKIYAKAHQWDYY